jgi:hypothetical protein
VWRMATGRENASRQSASRMKALSSSARPAPPRCRHEPVQSHNRDIIAERFRFHFSKDWPDGDVLTRGLGSAGTMFGRDKQLASPLKDGGGGPPVEIHADAGYVIRPSAAQGGAET